MLLTALMFVRTFCPGVESDRKKPSSFWPASAQELPPSIILGDFGQNVYIGRGSSLRGFFFPN